MRLQLVISRLTSALFSTIGWSTFFPKLIVFPGVIRYFKSLHLPHKRSEDSSPSLTLKMAVVSTENGHIPWKRNVNCWWLLGLILPWIGKTPKHWKVKFSVYIQSQRQTTFKLSLNHLMCLSHPCFTFCVIWLRIFPIETSYDSLLFHGYFLPAIQLSVFRVKFTDYCSLLTDTFLWVHNISGKHTHAIVNTHLHKCTSLHIHTVY